MQSLEHSMASWIAGLPKVELHLHLEGTFEPELMWKLSQRNKIEIPYKNIQEIRDSYNFSSLESFINLYKQGIELLRTEEDYYELVMEYMEKAHQNSIRHVEPFVDIQSHLCRGVPLPEVMGGIKRAFIDAKNKYGITSLLILCIVRDRSEEDALEALEKCLPYKDMICSVGLASCEVGHPPSKFKKFFERAQREGFNLCSHAGEEGPPDYIMEALHLSVQRIDHGVRCLESPEVIQKLKENQIPLTLCPLSNVALKVYDKMNDFPIHKFIEEGLLVTINSDDPAYFGGYLNKNFEELHLHKGLTKEEMQQLAKNSVIASFLSDEEKRELIKEIDAYH